jgi:DNA modification methylase
MKNVIITGDVLTELKKISDCCVDCCITSPPYYKLIDYGVPGQIGQEDTPEIYIERLTEVFAEVKRVLKPDGTLWIVIGDAYAESSSNKNNLKKTGEHDVNGFSKRKKLHVKGLREKNIIGIPWMLAFSLRAAGWYLRQDIIWHKTNNRPEKVTDRCVKAHEYIFLLSKSSKYYFDYKALIEPSKHLCGDKLKNLLFSRKPDVWEIPTGKVIGKVGKERHPCIFHKEIVLNCINAGCPVNGTVLDPFLGSGTTAAVAVKMKRNYIGIELNPEYVKQAKKNICNAEGLF